VYDRLALLVQNVNISRNIDQETLAILDRASPGKRTYIREKYSLAVAVLGGLGLGFGIIALMKLLRSVRSSSTKSSTEASRDPVKPSAAEHLEQLKALLEKGLLSKEAYDRKVEQITAAI
jgi:hypothetical protein